MLIVDFLMFSSLIVVLIAESASLKFKIPYPNLSFGLLESDAVSLNLFLMVSLFVLVGIACKRQATPPADKGVA